MDYLRDEASEDMSALISRDPKQELFYPKNLHRKFELSAAKFEQQLTFNNIYEREVRKVKDNRTQIKHFLADQ